MKLTSDLNSNIERIRTIFLDDATLIFRRFQNKNSTLDCCLCFIDGMINSETINENVILPIMKDEVKGEKDKLQYLNSKVLCLDETYIEDNLEEIIEYAVYGYSILLIDGCKEALLLNTKGWKTRAIGEPLSEVVVKGPREGFNECLIMNLSLIRKRITSSNFKIKFKRVGNETKTKVAICYLDGIAKENLVKEVEQRIDKIDIDGIVDSNSIRELIMDSRLAPFKTLETTERPDGVVNRLLEGRVAVLCDGSPNAITAPFLFREYFQSDEDNYLNFYFASINRIIRYIAFFLGTSVPALYVALTTYHQELIPTPLLLSIYGARQGVPFPTFLEVILMLLIFELLREAGIRLPKYVGQAVSIVGALVLGQAAVDASIVSAPVIIIVATTGIASFLIPKMKGGIIVVRIILLILSSTLGLYGYIFGIIGIFLMLMSIHSYGVPYMSHLNNINMKYVKETIVKKPIENEANKEE